MTRPHQLDAPAGLSELGDLADYWTRYLHNQFQAQLLYVRGQYTPFRTYRADLPVAWSGFPRQFLIEERDDRRNGMVHRVMSAYARAEGEYDSVTLPTASGGTFELKQRRHYEYLEWHVNTDDQGRPTKITFTCEPADYWSALADGYPARIFKLDGAAVSDKPGGRLKDAVLALYREHVSPDVQWEDLVCPEDVGFAGSPPLLRAGDYNPWNDWNTTYGIMHTTQLVNTVFQAIQIVGNSSVRRADAQGRLFQSAKALLCCGAYGGANHHSDPAIGAMVNELVRARYHVTNANPIGVYISHIEDAGWTRPDNTPLPRSFWRVVRVAEGQPGLPGSARTVRAEYAVPEGETVTVNGITRPMTLNDIRIGGEPVRYAGQIAEAVRMVLTVAAWKMTDEPPPAVRCQPGSRCYGTTGKEFLNIPEASRYRQPPVGPDEGEHDAFPLVSASQDARVRELEEIDPLPGGPEPAPSERSWRQMWPAGAEGSRS
jgi:hypothetical protein